jgi:hypothetical protein
MGVSSIFCVRHQLKAGDNGDSLTIQLAKSFLPGKFNPADGSAQRSKVVLVELERSSKVVGASPDHAATKLTYTRKTIGQPAVTHEEHGIAGATRGLKKSCAALRRTLPSGICETIPTCMSYTINAVREGLQTCINFMGNDMPRTLITRCTSY